jgi:uncharacterized membrane protein
MCRPSDHQLLWRASGPGADIEHWTWAVVIVDMSWGSFVTAVSSSLGLMIANWIAPKI